MANKNDINILINALLDEELNKKSINKQLKRIQSKINKLKVNVIIDDKTLKTLDNFSKQFKKIEKDAINTGKIVEEAIMPDGTKIKRTSFDGIGNEFSQIRKEAEKTKKSMEQVEGQKFDSTKKSLNEFTNSLDDNLKIAKEVTNENAKGQKTYQDTYKNLKDATSQTIKYNEQQEVLGVTTTKNYEQEEKLNKKRIDDLRKIAREREKLRRQLTGMRSTGQISESQFQDLSGRLITIKDTQNLNRYKESMSNLINETNKANTSQSKLNQKQGEFRHTLQKLHSQTKITEDQLKQFSNAVDTSKSIGQLKQLERQLDKVKSQTSSSSMSDFDLELEKRKFDNRATEVMRQYPSIDKKTINELQKNFKALESGTEGLRDKIRDYNMSLTETVTNTKQVTANTNTLLGAFQNAMIKFPIWIKC